MDSLNLDGEEKLEESKEVNPSENDDQVPIVETTQEQQSELPKDWKIVKDHPLDNVIGEITKGVTTRSSLRNAFACSARGPGRTHLWCASYRAHGKRWVANYYPDAAKLGGAIMAGEGSTSAPNAFGGRYPGIGGNAIRAGESIGSLSA
ncbi:hypothetical protein PIB30_105881 [Stylosanthes scabra]|uniref:Uncharacterized protein n=1 Tax=Stylosanthes scabra TaxID=79078 RepID=A0ABU6VXN5_9FABA|nr:hypothetical protein [Stylosanthes scabra]